MRVLRVVHDESVVPLNGEIDGSVLNSGMVLGMVVNVHIELIEEI